jgi:oligogalacturonide lyase
MAKGQLHPSETRWHTDARTGARLRQVTDAPCIHHHPFFFVPAHDQAMRYLFFVSHRSGQPQLYAELRTQAGGSGQLLQLTDHPDLIAWSLHPTADGRHLLFTTARGAFRLDMETLQEELLHPFERQPNQLEGMVGAAMGTTTVSCDGRLWAIPIRRQGRSQMLFIDLVHQRSHEALDNEIIGHPQFCPDDPELIFYAGPMTDRLWIATADGRRHERLYQRESAAQWITHESWIVGTRELAFVDWPHGMQAIQVDTGERRTITRFPAWHAYPDPSGQRFVCDTNFPDIGLHTFAARGPAEDGRLLCLSEASSVGSHWAGPFPYNDGPVKVYAPQHTHPHPRFSPDQRQVVFTSDRSGHAQVYECEVPA